MMRKMSVGLLTVLCCGVVQAASPADELLQSLNKQGYVSDSMTGGKRPCPCALIGVAKQADSEVVYLRTERNEWFSYRCSSIKGTSDKYICQSQGQVLGHVLTF